MYDREARVITPPPQVSSPATAEPQVTSPATAESRVAMDLPRSNLLAARISYRLLDRHECARLRLILDLLVLYAASGVALLGFDTVGTAPSNRWLAAVFPVIVASAMRARRAPDDRLNASILDTVAYALGVVSLSVMLTLSLDSVAGGAHPLGLATRLWLFAAVYLSTARAVLVSARRHAIRTEALSTPTLIVGAGVVGSQLVRRLTAEPG